MGKEALTKLSERATFTVRVFLNFSSRNILKFSLVQNLLHIREDYFIQNRLVIEAVLLTSIPFHTTISSHLFPFSSSLETCARGGESLLLTCFDSLLVCSGHWSRDFWEKKKKVYFIPSCLLCLSYFNIFL